MAGTKAGARKAKKKYGKDCFRRWGKKGGNPILLRKRNCDEYESLEKAPQPQLVGTTSQS